MNTVIEKPKSDSPFLPNSNLQFAWDSVSLGLLKECPRKYYLTLIEGWRSKSDSVHLTFGIHYHKALENFDKFRAQGLDRDEATYQTIKQLLLETERWEPDHNFKTRETLLRTVVWYLDEYKEDPAQTLLLSDGKPAVELSFRFTTDFEAAPGTPFVLCGHMDRLVEFMGDHFVMDRKTTGTTISAYYFKQFNPDNQMTLYTTASQVVYGMPVKGVIIDAVQIAVGFSRFDRGITLRSQGQLDEWMEDFKVYTDLARLYVETGRWPMNEKSCGSYGGCVFRDICSKDASVRHLFLETDFERKPWNPLEVR